LLYISQFKCYIFEGTLFHSTAYLLYGV
jgi:hypothetical protein